MGQQDQEESSPCPPKHLPDHRGTTEYPGQITKTQYLQYQSEITDF
jgi:hypothetical protein